MQKWYLEEECKNCGRIFRKFHKKHAIKSRTGARYNLRPHKSYTCSKKCSSLYRMISQKEYERKKIAIKKLNKPISLP